MMNVLVDENGETMTERNQRLPKLTAKDALRELMGRRIKKVMVAALKESEDKMYQDSFDYFRSRVLDCANDQIRMLADDFEKFEVVFATQHEIFLPPGKELENVTEK